MCRLIETIARVDGELLHLDEHRRRMERTCRELAGQSRPAPIESMVIDAGCPPVQAHLEKCRLLYLIDQRGHFEAIELSCTPYTPPQIASLALTDQGQLDYRHKYADRDQLNRLYAKRPTDCDDILLHRNGELSDTLFCNIALRCRQSGRWHTPQRPLLPGTAREQLLRAGVIIERPIRIEMLDDYDLITLFNALNRLGTIRFGVDRIVGR